MPRVLYTFAVLSESLLAKLPPVREYRELEAEHELLEQALLIPGPPGVAFYASVMDGWDRAHFLFGDYIQLVCPGVDWSALEDDAKYCVISPRELRDLHHPGHIPCPNANAYAVDAFGDTLHNLLTFVKATGCPGVIFASTLGPSGGDGDFKDR